MSTLKVDGIRSNSATSDAITLASDGTCTANITNNLSNRNLVINGSQIVSQRATQVTGVTTAGYRTCDRFNFAPLNLGTWTVDQSTDSPDGFSNSFKVTCTTADASPSAADYCFIRQYIEAQNLQHLAYGSSSAKETTLSFYVKSNKTGAANAYLYSPDTGKIFSFTYTISSADTWERKTQLIPADTASAIANDNAEGMRIVWVLNSGSNFQGGSVGGWKTFAESHINVNNLGVGGATSDNFAITGVQLEVGSVATDFEHRSFAQEFALCQRYLETSHSYGVYPFTDDGKGRFVQSASSNGAGNCMQFIFYATPKRAPATITGAPCLSGNTTVGQWGYGRSGAGGTSSVTFDESGTSGFRAYNSVGTNYVACETYGHWKAEAEL